MNVLLDTHAFIWFAEDDPYLSMAATAVIEESGNTIFVVSREIVFDDLGAIDLGAIRIW